MSKDPYRYFRIEAKEIVEQLSRGVLDLEQGASGKELVGRLLRLAHTLKGAAHVVKQAGIASLAHQLEDVLVAYKSDGEVPRQQEAMLGLVDGMATQLAALGSEQLQAVGPAAPAPPEESFETLRVDLGDMDVLLEGVTESSVRLAGLKSKFATLRHAADLATLLLSQMSAPGAGGGTERAAASLGKGRAIAEDMQALLRPLSLSLLSSVEQVERELAQVRDTASQLRLVPASAVFAPLRRTARNTAQTQGKQVDFVAVGGEHRLDAYVLAAVRDALLQIVRNAVVHGIEAPPERAAAGKAALGRVSLQVRRRGHRVVFACEDDGNGFDVLALRRAVVARGLVSAEAVDAFNSEDVFRLLLRGGISTSGTVTEVAGRGIGLDVVRETVSKLKAEVAMWTVPGRGSTVEIAVPVSLLSLSAVVVESGGLSASLPLDAVQQTLRLVGTDVVHSPDGDSIVFDGKTIPFLPLARALGQPSPRKQAETRFSAVVVRSGTEHAAVGVDRVLTTATVLLRPIPAFAEVDPIVAGAALDAEGDPQLVLDPAALVLAASSVRAISAQELPQRTPVVLVIDDSVTTRMLEQSILETAGYEVHLATSAEEALEKARAQEYDLFVVDVEMPGMNGFEFVTLARSTPALSDVPSILVTSRNSPQDRKRGEEAGARAYVVKSEFDQAQLLQTIRRLIKVK